MNLHEYQSKELFARYGIPVPEGRIARSGEEASTVAAEIGGNKWVVKAQVHAGGRGKGGGVRLVESCDEVGSFAKQLLGSRLVTPQTGAEGLPVGTLLVEQATTPARELYLGLLVDRAQGRVACMASDAGGMDIEAVAASEPERIHTVTFDPAAGMQGYQSRQLGFALGLQGGQIRELGKILTALYRLFLDCDASLIEVNPLVVTGEGTLLALDAKINLDDNALYRHPDLAEMRDAGQEDEREHAASEFDLNYITLDGNIGCLVNGAGLAMATMDLVKLHGGEPANFLDVGGGATAERVAEAFKLILSDAKVQAILVNIFGGIVRCDLIAEGIIQAARQVDLNVPVVVRLEGTNVDEGQRLLRGSGLKVSVASDLTEAAEKVVRAVENRYKRKDTREK